jgi:hypothetical protein
MPHSPKAEGPVSAMALCKGLDFMYTEKYDLAVIAIWHTL